MSVNKVDFCVLVLNLQAIADVIPFRKLQLVSWHDITDIKARSDVGKFNILMI